MSRFEQQMAFMLEVDKLKKITRQTYLSDKSRKENDTEHSWHAALMCYLMKEHSNREIDVEKTMAMLLIHDIVEIDAGDTYAYDEKGNETKAERENLAAERIFGILPSDQKEECIHLWQEFEEGLTPEASFARTMDNIQPLMLNDAVDGLAWQEHEVYEEMILKRNEVTKRGSTTFFEFCKSVIKKHIGIGNIKKGGKP